MKIKTNRDSLATSFPGLGTGNMYLLSDWFTVLLVSDTLLKTALAQSITSGGNDYENSQTSNEITVAPP